MSRKLHERFIPEKSSLSYADFHNEITKCEEGNSLNSNGKQKKKVICGRVSKDDELVKYMSSLPGYLEKGQKVGEGVLNVGVLDWGRLEQWRYGHKQVPHGSSGSSTSTSNISSSVSTDALSGNSTRGRSLSCYRERISRPSLQSHLIAPPMDDRSLADKHFEGSVGNCQNLRGSHSNFASQSKHVQADDLLSQNHPTSIMKGCNKKYLCPHIDTETDKLPNGRRYEAASCAKIVKSTQDVGMQKRLDNLQESNINTFEKAKLMKGKPVVVLMPRDISQNRHCGASSMCTSLGQKFGSPTRTSHSEKPKKPPHIYPNHDAPHSCFLPDVNKRSHSQPKGSASSSMDPEKIKTPASALPAPLPVKMGTSPCRSRKAEKRKHAIASSAIEPPQILEQKVTSEKSRSSSPFSRFSINLGFAGKGSGCKDVAHVPHKNSITDPKSCSENVICYTSTNMSGNVKPGNAVRSTTSPLRRLLDPLLKPKAANCRRYIELSQSDSVLIKKNCRSGNVKPSTFLPEKELDMDYRVDCTTTKTTDSSKEKKCVPSTFHALLRIAVKNGQPLFTFVVDNYSEILAATMKNITVTRKEECHSIYTFFTFREVKKKNGSWMNQAGKSKVPDYIHHAVAQMKVSESHCFDSTSQNCRDSSIAKVFVLFSVKLRQGNTQITDYQPNDELAAIVVKSPKGINFASGAHQNICQNDSQDLVHVTAVLPSGVHSLPSDGGPSSLIERWKTGGACDCGGWDLGCKLQILANQNQSIRNSRTSKANQFELFLQGNDQEHRPSFSLSPFKPGIYSVAFDSSFSILQAFSTCIALVDGNIYEISGPRCSVEGKDPTETLMVQTEEPKDFVKLANNPASYVAYPPVSPVGRV